MPGKRFWSRAVLLTALTPLGCASYCDKHYPCHGVQPVAYAPAPNCVPCAPAPAPAACCPPCCPQPCAPVSYAPQGTWSAPAPVPQTRLSGQPLDGQVCACP
jgi:hypothetical protein